MDRMIRCISSDGSFMVAAVDSTDTVCTAQSIHKTSAVASAALGRLLTASSLMGAMLKKEGASVTLKVKGGGPLGLL
ncbi:MAG TPA: Hsp33 family molecular chaperone HslO, partial [Ruminococcaceae bacterium]|nr:Hsp33 family molecular chaperone HslO [Oscillospiraceae bacterium]